MTPTSINIGLSGEYQFEITKADGSIESTGWMKNLVLDSGLDRLGNGPSSGLSGPVYYARVGTGTSTPTTSQTSLDSQLASQAATNSAAQSTVNSGAPNYTTTHVFKYSFAQGAVVGNISEVGVGWTAAAAGTLFSRSRIVDSSNNPTTLTIVALDQFTVYYRLQVTPSLIDVNGSVVIGGTTYNYLSRVASVGNFAGTPSIFTDNSVSMLNTGSMGSYSGTTTSTIGANTAQPTNTTFESPTVTSPTSYVPGSFYKDINFSWSISQAVYGGGLKTLDIYSSGGWCHFQYSFTPVIPKTNSNVLALTFRYSWNRS